MQLVAEHNLDGRSSWLPQIFRFWYFSPCYFHFFWPLLPLYWSSSTKSFYPSTSRKTKKRKRKKKTSGSAPTGSNYHRVHARVSRSFRPQVGAFIQFFGTIRNIPLPSALKRKSKERGFFLTYTFMHKPILLSFCNISNSCQISTIKGRSPSWALKDANKNLQCREMQCWPQKTDTRQAFVDALIASMLLIHVSE